SVAAVHSGWRGTKARIIERFFEHVFSELGSSADWVAVVGPAIGSCCYEVSEELAEDFAREFAWMERDLMLPRPRHLDLPSVNAAMLKRLGVGQLEVLTHCTHCAKDEHGFVFESYRRDHAGGRQMSLIKIKR
ncbi:polyphenol oxidase family protein, partial [Bdellovibrionota bacterium FG-1]